VDNDEKYVVLDEPRTFADEELDREVIEDLGTVTPYAEDREQWCAMPVRVVWDEAGGLGLEVGPYSLGGRDIDFLVSAIGRYYAVDMEMRAAADSGATDE
jgi:hypothetical protein